MDEDLDDIRKLEEVLSSELNENDKHLQKQLNEFIIDANDNEGDENDNDHIVIDITTNWNLSESLEVTKLVTNMTSVTLIDLESIKPYLSPKEYDVIIQCQDQDLQEIMILNRVKMIQIKNLEVHLHNLYVQCLNCQSQINTGLDKKRVTRLFLGYPYFKTKNGNTCPPNDDVKRKELNGEIWPYYMVRLFWNSDDLVDLKKSVAVSYHRYKMKLLEQEYEILKKYWKNNKMESENEILLEKIRKVEGDIENLIKNPYQLYPSLNMSFENNWKEISIEMNNRHSAESCQGVWTLFLHPSINREKWTPNENKKLKSIAEKYSCQKWHLIASKLGTKRSAFTVCVQYFSLIGISTKKLFTQQEDEKLLETIKRLKVGDYIPWQKVTYNFEDRTRRQLYSRYKTMLVYDNQLRKGPFSKAEDILLYCIIQRHGKDFKLCETLLGRRSQLQIRSHYKYYLARCHERDIEYGNWTIAEDRKIIDHYQNSEVFSAAQLAKDIDRMGSSIRYRMQTLVGWLADNPDKTIEDMPRTNVPVRRRNVYSQSVLDVYKLGDEYLQAEGELSLEKVTQWLDDRNNDALGSACVSVTKPVKFDIPDENLIGYFRNVEMLYKQTNSPNCMPDNMLSKQIQVYLNTLGACVDEKKLHARLGLDITDTNLSAKGDDAMNKLQSDFCPPTTENLIGLRTLLLGFANHKKKYSNLERKKYFQSMSDNQSTLAPDLSKVFTRQKELFINRFKYIFTSASLLSSVSPKGSLAEHNNEKGMALERRKRGRPPKDLTKIRLMLKKRKENAERTAETGRKSTYTNKIHTMEKISSVSLNDSVSSENLRGPLRTYSRAQKENHECTENQQILNVNMEHENINIETELNDIALLDAALQS